MRYKTIRSLKRLSPLRRVRIIKRSKNRTQRYSDKVKGSHKKQQVHAKRISQANRRIAANGFQVHEEQRFPRTRYARQALQRFRRKVRLHSRSFGILNFF